MPFFEVVSHACKSAVKSTKNGKIAVIGTAATVSSGQHKNAILKLMPNAQVITCACPLFVPLVEAGWYKKEDTVVIETVRRYLQTIIDFGADTLILGCTHYPILSEAISFVLGDGVALINAGTATAGAVSEFLKQTNTQNDNGGKHSFFVSDKPEFFKGQASILLQRDIDESFVQKVDINSL